MRLFLAIILPWLQFFTIGKPISGVICLLLQLTIIGWVPAAIWSVYALSQYKTKKEIEKHLKGASMTRMIGIVLVAFILCVNSQAFSQGIPVIDASNIAQSITNSIKEIAEMQKQLQQLQQQYNQMVKQYNSMTSGRGLGLFEHNAQFKDYLPNEWKGTYDSIRSGGYSGLTSSGQSVRSNNQKYDICRNMFSEMKAACERQVSVAYQHRANSTEAYDKAKTRIEQIEKLMKKAGETEDQKEILELNARIQAEQAMIKNEAIKLQMYQMISDGERRLAEQQRREASAKRMSQKGGIKVEPIDVSR